MKKLNEVVALLAAFALMFGIVSCNPNADENLVYYSVTFDSDGGNDVDAIKVEKGKKVTEPEAPIKTGYDFGGWYNGETKYDFSSAVTKKLTLLAKWTVHTYTITYNLDGGTNNSGNPATYTIKDEITLKDAEKTGSTFSGWYNGNTKVTKIAKGTTGDITLSATWNLQRYDVTLNTDGGTIADNKNVTSYTYGTAATLPTASDITRSGYKFCGWFVSNDNGTTLTGEAVSSITATDIGNKVFYAKWLEVYNITYNINYSGALTPPTNPSSNPATYTIESDTITLAPLELKGYTFEGWYDKETEGEKVTQITKGSTGDKTLWARWTIIPYTLTINGIGKSGRVFLKADGNETGKTLDATDNTFSYTVEDSIKFNPNEFDWKGDKGEGVYDAEGNKVTEISKGSTGDRTLWVHWNLTTYTITYTGLPENVTNPNPTTYTLADLPIKLKKVTNEGTLYSWQIPKNDNQNVVFPTFPHPNDSILEGTHGNITVTVKAVAISNVTLVEGTEINSILRDWDEATSFRKNDTEPDNENSLNHIGGTYPNMQIPVWYNSETKTIWYYAPEGAVLYMNADSSQMFSQMNKLEIIDLSDFDTSNVTNMSKMFYNCSALTSLDVSNWNTSNVTNMEYMFCDCRKLAELDVSNFDTSNVTNMVRMFQNCSELTALDVSKFETGNVTNMSTMFCGCTNLAELDVSSFDTSKVTNMDFMFSGCNNLAELDVSSFDTSKVTNMSWMFNDCSLLTSLDVSEWNTNNVTSMDYMFYGCRALTTIYVTRVTDWSTSETLASSSCMFLSCYKLVGGSDTGYNASKTDKTYARVDGGTDSPGYFTVKK